LDTTILPRYFAVKTHSIDDSQYVPWTTVVTKLTPSGSDTTALPELDEKHDEAHRGVAVQVEFERHILEPVFHFIGQGLKPGAFQLKVRGSQRAPPHRRRVARITQHVHEVAAQVDPFEIDFVTRCHFTG
jgi:hypothetical protein